MALGQRRVPWATPLFLTHSGGVEFQLKLDQRVFFGGVDIFLCQLIIGDRGKTFDARCNISIGPGVPETWVAVVPSTIARGVPFALKIKAEDTWGNPTDKAALRLTPKSSQRIDKLPDYIDVVAGDFATVIPGLVAHADGPLHIK